jgi:hypothetical protein
MDQRFSLHDQSLWQRNKAIYPFAAFKLEARCDFQACLPQA